MSPAPVQLMTAGNKFVIICAGRLFCVLDGSNIKVMLEEGESNVCR